MPVFGIAGLLLRLVLGPVRNRGLGLDFVHIRTGTQDVLDQRNVFKLHSSKQGEPQHLQYRSEHAGGANPHGTE